MIRITISTGLFAAMLVCVASLWATASATDIEPTGVSSRIRKVTVFSDRAQITRTGTVRLSSSPSVYAVRRLPGWVDDGSVRVSLAGGGRIVDVQVKRDYLARATDEGYRKAEAEVAELNARMAALNDELDILKAQGKQIAAIKAFSLEKVSRDTTLRDVNVESYGNVLEFITRSLRDTAKQRRAVERERQRLAPELEARRRALQEQQSLTQLEQTSVYVTAQGSAGTDATLELTYMLPGATWEPTHELRTSGPNPKSAEVASYAVVTQTSGEDWENVELAFATQSSTESVRIPELEALTLGEAQTTNRITEHRMSSFTRAQQAFQGQNRMWNKMNAWKKKPQQKASFHSNFEQVYENNFKALQVVQSRTVQIFQKLQKRGTSAHYRGQGRLTVRGDGHSVRVPLGKSNLIANQKIVAAPEQSLNAARTLQMTNSSGQPLLPGKVGLYKDGSFLGLTELAFIAEGEQFAVFLSVADQIKLSRVLDKKHSSLVRKVRTRMQVAFIVTVENLSDEPATIELADRVPVSEDREVKIDKVKIAPQVTPNSKGLLHWTVALKPKEKRTFTIGYRIEYPPTLIVRTRARKQRRMAHPASPAAQQPQFDFSGDEEQLHEKIMDLESNF